MSEVAEGFYWGFGFFWGLCGGIGSLALVALFVVVIIGGLADRYQRIIPDDKD